MARAMGRIRKRESFRALARPDGKATSGPVTVAYASTQVEGPFPAVGYAIGRRHGSAVVRNRLRRRLRAAMTEVAPDLPPGAYLVRAAPSAGARPFDELCRSVSEAASAASTRGPRRTADGAPVR